MNTYLPVITVCPPYLTPTPHPTQVQARCTVPCVCGLLAPAEDSSGVFLPRAVVSYQWLTWVPKEILLLILGVPYMQIAPLMWE